MSRKKKKKQEDSFIYLLLLSIIVVLSTVLSLFNIYLSVLVIPIIIYLINYIYRNYDYKETLSICLISISMIIVYLFLLYNLENRVIDILEVIKYSFIYFIVMFINIIINKYIKNTSYLKTSISYILPMIIYLVLFIVL